MIHCDIRFDLISNSHEMFNKISALESQIQQGKIFTSEMRSSSQIKGEKENRLNEVIFY